MRRVGEIVGAAVLVVAAVLFWNLGVDVHSFDATPDGEPAFDAVRYSGSWISASTVAVLGAALLLIDAVRVTLSRRSPTG